jgi:AMMECR1 domain-containing protein
MECTLDVQHMDPFAELASRSIHVFVKSGHVLSAPRPLPSEMARRAGVFVSIKKQGQLRGCIGTFFPSEETIAH